jgi:transcriptional regulator with XRE-family HTH domain
VIGKKITELRNKKGLTQLRAAKMLKMPRSTYSNYELDKREPDFDTAQKLASFFEISVDELLGVVPQNTLIEETEMERMKREIREIVSRAKTEEDVKSVLHVIKKALKE